MLLPLLLPLLLLLLEACQAEQLRNPDVDQAQMVLWGMRRELLSLGEHRMAQAADLDRGGVESHAARSLSHCGLLDLLTDV